MNGKCLGCALVLALILGSGFVASSAAAAPPFGWAVAAPIETDSAGDASNPAIAANGAGVAFAVWQQFDGTRLNIWSNRHTISNGWETTTPIESSLEPALKPQVAVDPLGNALAVWEQSDGIRNNIWANRYVAGAGWSTPAIIETDNAGNAYNPTVAVDAGGSGIAVWEQYDGVRWRAVANRYVAGVGWGTPVVLDSGVGGGTLGTDVAVDPTGNAIAVWVGCCGPANVWARRFTVAAGWDNATLIETGNVGDSLDAQVGFDGNGNAMAVWRYWDGSARSAWSNRFVVGSGWGVATPVGSGPGDVAEGIQVALDPGGNATAVWGQWDGLRTNIWANRYAAGAWGPPVLLESDGGEARDPQVAVDARNNAIAVWWQLSGATANIFANRFMPVAGWVTATVVEMDNAGHASFPQVATDGAGNAVVVWQHSDGARYNIWANEYTRDNVPPELAVTSPAGSLTNNPSVTLAGTTEPGAIVTVDGTSVAVDANGAFSSQLTLPDGPHTFTILATDLESNIATALRTITVDTAAPAVTIDSPATGTVTNRSTARVSGTTEPGAGVVVNGLVVSVGPSGVFALDVALAPGTNVITAMATDAAGNTATASVSVTLDILAPSLALSSPTPMVTNDPNVLVEGATEPGATVTVDGSPVFVDAGGRFTRLVSLLEGPHTFVVVARDFAGNAASASVTVVVDLTVPILSITSPSDGFRTAVASVRVTGTAEPAARLIIMGVIAAIAADGSFAIELALTEGPNVIAATAMDQAGNVATASVTVTYLNPVPGLEQELNAARDDLAVIRDILTNQTQDLRETRDALAAANANLIVSLSLLLVLAVVTVLQFVLYWRLRGQFGRSGPPPGRE